MPRLENWSIICNDDPYLAPELRTVRLAGYIYDDEKCRFKDGDPVATSSLREFNYTKGYAQTRNTKYILGKIDTEFQKFMNDNGYKIENYIK